MRYTIHSRPLCDLESIAFIKGIINNKSTKDEISNILERRGNRFKSVVSKFFSKTLALEKHIRKNIILDMLGYETTGKQMAEFLFKERGEDKLIFADAIFYNNYAATVHGQVQINKEIVIIAAIDEIYLDEAYGSELANAKMDSVEFFTFVEECDMSDEDKLGAIKLYLKFDMYLQYATELLGQVEQLINQKLPDFNKEITALTSYLSSELETRGMAFLRDSLNITLDDKHVYQVYPGIYAQNSISFRWTGFTDVLIIVGLHIFDFIKTFDELGSDSEKAELFLKCLSDNTKLSILKLLKDGPMYGSQLAEKLDCTGANISHHMSSLISLDMVYVRKENNRAYLHLNKDVICQYLDDAKGLFL